VPQNEHDGIPYCDYLGNLCFSSFMKSVGIFDNCNCSSDCKSTTFSIIDTRQILNVKKVCAGELPLDYSYHLSYTHKLWFSINNLKGLEMNRSPTEQDLCKYFLTNHFTAVKVEIATKSMMRSVRDRRFSFETQLSSLGI